MSDKTVIPRESGDPYFRGSGKAGFRFAGMTVIGAK